MSIIDSAVRVFEDTSPTSVQDEIQTYVGRPATAQTYHELKALQYRVFQSWTNSTTTGSSVTMNDWPTSWLDVSTTSGTTTNILTFTDNGVTNAAETVWRLSGWQNSEHSPVRWTPTVHRNPKSAEELAREAAERERRRQIRLRQDARKRRFKEAAVHRARELLKSMLTEEQQRELEDKNRFHLTVHSRDGSMRVYRIDYGFQGNVKLIGPDGEVDRSYCIHADSRLPYEDQMLAQKLLLESNEPEFLRIANETIRRRRAA